MAHSAYPILDLTFLADEDLSSKQFHVVELTPKSNSSIRLHTNPNVAGIGILRNKPTFGEPAAVKVLGVSEVAIAPGTITIGRSIGPEKLGTQYTGRVCTPTTAGTPSYGTAIEYAQSAPIDLATCLVDFTRYALDPWIPRSLPE